MSRVLSTPVLTILLAVWFGCSSSEETGANRGGDKPGQTGPIATAPRTAESQVPGSREATRGGSRGPQAEDPRVRRSRDTVTASTQRMTRSAIQRQPLQKPPDAMYTVQVGAYKRAPNALSMQKTLRGDHGDQPVFNMFNPSEGLYRVTIGKFETLAEATNYRNMLLKKQPQRYGECWVTYIERSRK